MTLIINIHGKLEKKMFREYIEEDSIPVIFETSKPVLFSIIKDGTFNKTWEPWTERHFELKEDSTLVYRKKKDKSIIKRLDLKNTNISKMALDVEIVDSVIQDSTSSIEKEVGIVVTCTSNGYLTSFRCILNEYELHKFFTAVQSYVINPTVDADALNLDTYKKTNKKRIIPSLTQSNNDQQSFMRQSLMFAMDKYSRKTKQEQILLRRG